MNPFKEGVLLLISFLDNEILAKRVYCYLSSNFLKTKHLQKKSTLERICCLLLSRVDNF